MPPHAPPSPLSRRTWLGTAFTCLAAPVQAEAVLLPTPASLRAEAAAAQRRGRALVVLFSLPGCPWCKLVRESYLQPLRREGQPVFEIDLTSSAPVVAFDGEPVAQSALARALGVRVAPTVLFLGDGGRELTERLRGVSSTDFYGAYLEERIATANGAAVHHPSLMSQSVVSPTKEAPPALAVSASRP
jgi:hypothetical protein